MVYQKQGRNQKRQQMQPSKLPQEQQLKKAKIKALRLLERMDRTEAQLHEKLMDAGFDAGITDQAMAYVKSFGYLDDERYVRNYIESRKNQKSRRQLEQELEFRKGVPKELIRKVYDDLEPADEKVLIRKALQKKHYCPETCDEKQRQKLIASLLRKGFGMRDILSVMEEESEVV